MEVEDLNLHHLFNQNPGKNACMGVNAFAEAIDQKTTAERKEDLRRQLSEYCNLDTLAMVGLWKCFLGLNEPKIVAFSRPG